MLPNTNPDSSINWRYANAAHIAAGLQSLRAQTLAMFDAYLAANQLTVPCSDELNPPLWELGHIGWFQEHWIGRNQQRHLGIRYDAEQTRLPSLLAESDSFYDSSHVPHATRWDLPLPDAKACKSYLTATLQQTLNWLQLAGESDNALYFYRLVLFHEAMHLEAATYMAQTLNTPIAIKSIAVKALKTKAIAKLISKNNDFLMGSLDAGFVFDNELGAHSVSIAAFEIDQRCVSWRDYLNFVEATHRHLPRYVRRTAQGYEKLVFGLWEAIDFQAPAVHVNLVEAQDYCAWAGRRLPTEAEWELAASTLNPDEFHWGEVWEWTATVFAPYSGFVAHPYQDYSEPWFGSRQVLRGACVATQPMMRNAKYRNYFAADRTDIFAGFRTCAISG